MFIYLVSVVKDSAIIGFIVSANESVENAFFYTWLLTLFYLIIITIWGVCISFKRYGGFQCCFFVFLHLLMVVCMIFGAIILIFSAVIANEIDETCTIISHETGYVKRLETVYSNAATVFCTSSCPCYYGSTYYSSLYSSSSGNKKVQECDQYLMSAYSNYDVVFDDVGHLKRYLDNFGKIEQEYKCSGICSSKLIYYFSDSSSGKFIGEDQF